MIILNEISDKLKRILNGTDSEVLEVNPLKYYFEVMTQGFHLDHVKGQGGNFIPVFVSSLGGTYNPIPKLGEANASIPITFYFPVRFKEDFFLLAGYLSKTFVGAYLNYGEKTKRAVSNISVPSFGEIQNLDLREFKSWMKDNFQTEIDTMEAWMSMNFNLYLSNMNEGFVYGNDSTSSVLAVMDGEIFTDELVFVDSTIQSTSETANEQLLGTNEVRGMPTTTAYGFGLSFYYKDTDFCNKLVEKWFSGDIQKVRLTYSQTIGGKTFTRTSYVQSMNMPIRQGQAVTITLSLGVSNGL